MAETSKLAAVGEPTDEAQSIRLSLSPRRRQVMGMLCRGIDYPDIAREMQITTRTARNHVSDILDIVEDTLGWRPRGRFELIAWAWMNGFVHD